MSDLRDRQRALARQTIVDATAELVTERRHLDFAMKEVADRAGVALRTVYNHFPDRQDLLDALGQSFNEQMESRGGPNAAALGRDVTLADAIRTNLGLFEELGGISEAFAQMPLADVGLDAERTERTKRIVDHVAATMPAVPADTARSIAVLARHLLSHRSWFWLTREYGLETADVAELVVWAVATLVDAANAGDLPEPPEHR